MLNLQTHFAKDDTLNDANQDLKVQIKDESSDQHNEENSKKEYLMEKMKISGNDDLRCPTTIKENSLKQTKAHENNLNSIDLTSSGPNVDDASSLIIHQKAELCSSSTCNEVHQENEKRINFCEVDSEASISSRNENTVVDNETSGELTNLKQLDTNTDLPKNYDNVQCTDSNTDSKMTNNKTIGDSQNMSQTGNNQLEPKQEVVQHDSNEAGNHHQDSSKVAAIDDRTLIEDATETTEIVKNLHGFMSEGDTLETKDDNEEKEWKCAESSKGIQSSETSDRFTLQDYHPGGLQPAEISETGREYGKENIDCSSSTDEDEFQMANEQNTHSQ